MGNKSLERTDPEFRADVVSPVCWAAVIRRGEGELEVASLFAETATAVRGLILRAGRSSDDGWVNLYVGSAEDENKIPMAFWGMIHIVHGHWVVLSRHCPTAEESKKLLARYQSMFPREKR